MIHRLVTVTNKVNLTQKYHLNNEIKLLIQLIAGQAATSLRILLNYKNSKMSRNKAVFIIALNLLFNGLLEENFDAINIIVNNLENRIKPKLEAT